MHITIPRIYAQPGADTERLKAQIGILRIECRSLCEQLQQRQDAYNQTLAERDAALEKAQKWDAMWENGQRWYSMQVTESIAAERDAYQTAYTAAQLQLSAMCERNDELNAELAEARAECAAKVALLRCVAAVSVPGPELRLKIEAATKP